MATTASEGNSLMSTASDVEKYLNAMKGTIHSILVYDQNGDFVLYVNFTKESIDFKAVGGLVVAINEFTGRPTKRTIRTIKMKEMELKFASESEILFVFVIDREQESIETNNFINKFLDGYKISFAMEESDGSISQNDLIATSIVKLFLLTSDELQPDVRTSPQLDLDLELIYYNADKKISQILSNIYTEQTPLGLEETVSEEQSSETEVLSSEKEVTSHINEGETSVSLPQSDTTPLDSEITSSDEQLIKDVESNPQNAIIFMLRKFNQSFPDISLTTVVAISPSRGIETFCEGSLPDYIIENLNKSVLEMSDLIYEILNLQPLEKILELGDYFAIFEAIDEGSFMYVITKTHDTAVLLQPIVERMCLSIRALIPQE